MKKSLLETIINNVYDCGVSMRKKTHGINELFITKLQLLRKESGMHSRFSGLEDYLRDKLINESSRDRSEI